jgi:hypothetical protein
MTSPDGGYYQSYRGTFDQQRAFDQPGGPAAAAAGQVADRVPRWTAGLDRNPASDFSRGTSNNLGGGGGVQQNGPSRQGSLLDPGSLGGGGGDAPQQQQHAHVSGHAFTVDQWVYKDPQGMVQGPFTKVGQNVTLLQGHSFGLQCWADSTLACSRDAIAGF